MNIMEKTRKILLYTFYIVFILLFGYIVINCLFNNHVNFLDGNIVIILTGIVIFGIILFFIYKLLSKRSKNSNVKIIAITFIILITIQILFAIWFYVKPSWDFGSVYYAAVDSAQGKEAISDVSYFYQYSNNIALAIGLKYVYKIASLFGIENFISVGIVSNIMCIDIAILFTYLTAKHIFGQKKALFAFFIMCIMTPIITYVPIFYTDTISMPFIILPIYLDIIAGKTDNKKKKILYYTLAGIFITMGMLLKFTAVIILIALFITKILFAKRLNDIYSIAYIIVPVIVLFGLWNLMQSKLFDEAKLDKEQFPYTHWVMMGLTDKGGYCEEDVEYTFKFDTKQQKQEGNIKVIKERLKNYIDSNKLIEFYTNKLVYTWGDGTYFAPEKLGRNVQNFGIYHEFILNSGKYKDYYLYFSQIEHMTIMVLILFSAIVTLINKSITLDKYKFCFLLSVFGLILFLLIWETRSRYIINYIPIFILLASYGMDYIYNRIVKVKFLKEA